MLICQPHTILEYERCWASLPEKRNYSSTAWRSRERTFAHQPVPRSLPYVLRWQEFRGQHARPLKSSPQFVHTWAGTSFTTMVMPSRSKVTVVVPSFVSPCLQNDALHDFLRVKLSDHESGSGSYASHRFDKDRFQRCRRHPPGNPEDFDPYKVILLIVIENDAGPHLFRVLNPGVGQAHVQRIGLFVNSYFHGFTLLSRNTVITRWGFVLRIYDNPEHFPASFGNLFQVMLFIITSFIDRIRCGYRIPYAGSILPESSAHASWSGHEQ